MQTQNFDLQCIRCSRDISDCTCSSQIMRNTERIDYNYPKKNTGIGCGRCGHDIEACICAGLIHPSLFRKM